MIFNNYKTKNKAKLIVILAISVIVMLLLILKIWGFIPKSLYYPISWSLISIMLLSGLFDLLVFKKISKMIHYKSNIIVRLMKSYEKKNKLENILIKHFELDKQFFNLLKIYDTNFIFLEFKNFKKLLLFINKYINNYHKYIDMGEIADDMINGSCCNECGCYFKNPGDEDFFTHGYPVLCWDCWDKKSNLPRAEVETF